MCYLYARPCLWSWGNLGAKCTESNLSAVRKYPCTFFSQRAACWFQKSNNLNNFSLFQNYLRFQPDNVRTMNLVTEVTTFINTLYTHINRDTIDTLTQVVETLNEICQASTLQAQELDFQRFWFRQNSLLQSPFSFLQGNQENRVVILNNKIIDYINFILRVGRFADCDPNQVISLKTAIGTLLRSLIEESGPEAFLVAKVGQEFHSQNLLFSTHLHLSISKTPLSTYP